MKTWSTLLAVSAALTSSLALAEPVDTAKSQVLFTFKQMNVPVDGKFAKFKADISYDAAKPEKSTAQVELDLAGTDAGSADANTEVRRKSWFDLPTYPVAKFVSSSVKPLGGGKFEATGKLTIKGKTQDASIPFSVKSEAGAYVFEGQFVLQRLKFGLGEGVWADTETVANDVAVKFKLVQPAKK